MDGNSVGTPASGAKSVARAAGEDATAVAVAPMERPPMHTQTLRRAAGEAVLTAGHSDVAAEIVEALTAFDAAAAGRSWSDLRSLNLEHDNKIKIAHAAAQLKLAKREWYKHLQGSAAEREALRVQRSELAAERELLAQEMLRFAAFVNVASKQAAKDRALRELSDMNKTAAPLPEVEEEEVEEDTLRQSKPMGGDDGASAAVAPMTASASPMSLKQKAPAPAAGTPRASQGAATDATVTGISTSLVVAPQTPRADAGADSKRGAADARAGPAGAGAATVTATVTDSGGSEGRTRRRRWEAHPSPSSAAEDDDAESVASSQSTASSKPAGRQGSSKFKAFGRAFGKAVTLGGRASRKSMGDAGKGAAAPASGADGAASASGGGSSYPLALLDAPSAKPAHGASSCSGRDRGPSAEAAGVPKGPASSDTPSPPLLLQDETSASAPPSEGTEKEAPPTASGSKTPRSSLLRNVFRSGRLSSSKKSPSSSGGATPASSPDAVSPSAGAAASVAAASEAAPAQLSPPLALVREEEPEGEGAAPAAMAAATAAAPGVVGASAPKPDGAVTTSAAAMAPPAHHDGYVQPTAGARAEDVLPAGAYLRPVSERPSAFSWSAHATACAAGGGTLLATAHTGGATLGVDAESGVAAAVGRLVATAARARAMREQSRSANNTRAAAAAGGGGGATKTAVRRLHFDSVAPPSDVQYMYGQSVVRGILRDPATLASLSARASASAAALRSSAPAPYAYASLAVAAPPSVLSRSYPGSAAAAARAGLALPPALPQRA